MPFFEIDSHAIWWMVFESGKIAPDLLFWCDSFVKQALGIDTTKKAMEMLQERDKERIGLLYLYFWHQN